MAAHPGDSSCPCPQEFLQTLINDLLEIRATCLTHGDFEDDELDHDETEDCLAVIGDEIDRLDKHPELFPSEDTRQQFFHFVRQILQDWSVAFNKIKAMQMKHKDAIQEAVYAEKHRTRSAYTVNRKPWQQFLHNKAPGSGMHTREMDQNLEGSTQLLPMGGCRLFHSWAKDCYEVTKEIKAVSAISRIFPMLKEARN